MIKALLVIFLALIAVGCYLIANGLVIVGVIVFFIDWLVFNLVFGLAVCRASDKKAHAKYVISSK